MQFHFARRVVVLFCLFVFSRTNRTQITTHLPLAQFQTVVGKHSNLSFDISVCVSWTESAHFLHKVSFPFQLPKSSKKQSKPVMKTSTGDAGFGWASEKGRRTCRPLTAFLSSVMLRS